LPYLINETSSPGFGPILLKTRITVHNTNTNPVVTIENRNKKALFNGTATVTPPYLNDSSLRTFVANGAAIGRTTSVTKVDQLPSTFLATSEKHIRLANVLSLLKPITFKVQIPATASASQIYSLLMIPTYPVNIA
jgi:hypothetical protein